MAFSVSFNGISFALILVSLAFLVISTVSAPVSSAIALASTADYKYGIFGYCESDNCPQAVYPYSLSTKDDDASWLLGGATRDTLAKAFILCPIAAGLNLLCLILVGLSFCFSSGVLLFALVFNIVCFIATALIAVFVVVVFHPHVAWAGWILIGAAVANLISILMLFLTLKFSNNYDDVSDTESNHDLTRFDEKFNETTTSTFLPPKKGGYDDNSSFSNDYEFKMQQPHQVATTITDSSVFNSNPHLVKDFTQHSNGSSGSHYEDARANLVNGPNTPILAKQQIAPNYTPTVATPTRGDAPRSRIPVAPPQKSVPYPVAGPLNKPPYSGTDMSVFEHHPEVEGHRPFTELPDDGSPPRPEVRRTSQGSASLGSDVDSDFTSVSQRAINPNYRPTYYEQQQFQGAPQYPQSSPYQPQFQQMAPPPPNNAGPPISSGNYVPGPSPAQQRYKGPTISDNALSNNPDFALGGMPGGRRKQQPFRSAMGPPRGPGAPMGGPSMNGTPMGGPGRYNGPGRRDGPYGAL